ncbi:hypothetical protein PVAND_007575 [Polypedilum vanderplanki]|uniref:Uncharacterized protein n=1 Tax=Polypedilum vanderplanki TaxID=319348 RepID=A0A9J6C7C7_POLVA|nr:hypothetical protein PVAND_007575 [Polypedilum vanderplanki]
MGKGQSKTRTVSFENESPGIIDISEDVVSRLKKDMQKEREIKRAEIREQQQQQHSPVIQQLPTVVYQSAPTITALQIRKEKEAELKANDQYWANRLNKQEKEFLKNNKILQKEFDDTINEVKSRFQHAAFANHVPPCQEFKSRIIDCYRRNPTETLKCASEVKDFMNCINSARTSAVDAKQNKNPAPSA